MDLADIKKALIPFSPPMTPDQIDKAASQIYSQLMAEKVEQAKPASTKRRSR